MGFTLRDDAKCAVIGYGSWATAIVKILLENEQKVYWHIAKKEVSDHIISKGSNPRYLSDVALNTDKLVISNEINEIVSQADIIILAVPSAFLKNILQHLDVGFRDKFIISAIKGIIPGDFLTIAEYINNAYNVPFDRIGIVTGPCHSEEVALERLSYLTMVTKDLDNAAVLCRKFSTDYISVSASRDIYGAEYAAILKNIYAICAGMAVGLGYGDNFMSVLVSNSAMEMNKFLEGSYCFDRDTSASAYLGDLLVTCYSQFSRNRTFGAMIGKGYSITSAMAEMSMVAEGYYATACIRQVNKRFGIDMPIADCVYNVLYNKEPVAAQMRLLTKKLF